MKEHHTGPENPSERPPSDIEQDKPSTPSDTDSLPKEFAPTIPRSGLGDSTARKQHEEKYSSSTTQETPSETGEETTEEDREEPEVLSGEALEKEEKETSSLATLSGGSSGDGPPALNNNGYKSGSSGSEPEKEEEGIDPNAPRGEEQDLWSHLSELRARILYSIAAVALMSVVTWSFGQDISEWFARPIRSVLAARDMEFPEADSRLVTLNPTEGFLVYFQITVVSAILITMPFILYQMWRFLEPALTRTERRFTQVLLPFAVLLFFLGCGLGYAVAPLFFGFFMLFQPPGTDANFSYSSSIVLLAKMILVFGLCFQVPIITIFLNKIGVISRNFLIDYWRHAVVLIFFIVAVLTPTWDPVTLIVCAGPPCLLYGLSIWIMKWL